MEYVQDFTWKKGMSVKELGESFKLLGFQSIELGKAIDIIVKMKSAGAKIYLTFTSNMATSGLRGFFAQLIHLGLPNVIVTTVGGIEEDIMKAHGEKFPIGDFHTNDIALNEQGLNRVGNILITNESYCLFEDLMQQYLRIAYQKKVQWTPSELLQEIGLNINDENSILAQAAKNNVPIFCPAITDGSFGFHLFLFQQKHKDFIVDVVKDFENIILSASHDEKKGLISLGGGVSKHHAILACLINGGVDYAIYMTTSRPHSGSVSGATTDEAKSWGKIKEDSDVATVIGDVSITFPIAMCAALDILSERGIINKNGTIHS